MASDNSRSRPAFVYLLALTAMLLFTVHMVTYLNTIGHHVDQRIVLDEHVTVPDTPTVAVPDTPDVGVPMSRLQELRQEVELARKEFERVQRNVETIRGRSLELSFSYPR